MKQFLCKWGEGYVNPQTSTLTFEDISNENGWDDWAIKKVDALQIGEACDCSDISGVLFVQRIA